jgi:hypothetical protein
MSGTRPALPIVGTGGDPARADSGSDRDFPFAPGRAHQQQIRHIGAGNSLGAVVSSMIRSGVRDSVRVWRT